MEQSVIVRSMTVEDIDKVVQIEKETFSLPWSKKSFEEALINPQNLFLVVDRDAEIIGYCGLLAVLDEGQIANVAIKSEYRHLGLGYNMMNVLLEEGRKRGLSAFTLEVRLSNLSAQALYKKLGFIEAGLRPGFYDKPKEDAVIMWYYC